LTGDITAYLMPAKNHRRREEHALPSASALPMAWFIYGFVNNTQLIVGQAFAP